MAQQTIFTVSEANEFIKLLLDQVPQLQSIFVRGEISNYKLYPSGHHYFTLKDESGAMRCVMFRNAAAHLRFRPENGMKVIAFGRIGVFPRDGAYQLYCTELTAEGVGDLHVAFEQLKAKLDAEGLFAPEHKKPLPRFPQRIAIITSEAGAAVHDMIRILRRRYPLAAVSLLPVRVQGEEAPPEIVGAIRYANRWNVADVLIVGRGGGSIEDLWAFNDERVARAIYDSALPVISAVGHEPDVTIADYVADARASTPSNAAEIAVPDREALRRALRDSKERLLRCESERLKRQRAALSALTEKRALRDPMAFLADKRMLLDYTQRSLTALARQEISAGREKFAALCASLDALSPVRVLGRGYAVARTAEGKILRSAAEARIGERISVTLGQGGLLCAVEEKTTGGTEDGADV